MSDAIATAEVATPANAETTATIETTAPAAAATTTTTATTEATTEVASADVPAWSEKFPSKYKVDGKPDIEKLITGYEHLNKKLSSKGYAPPADIAEYDYTPQHEVDAEAFTAFKGKALELGVNKDQFAGLLAMHDAEIAKILPSADAAEAQLKEFYGNDYPKEISSAKRAFAEFSDDTISADDPILNHPTVIKLLANMGHQLGEDSQSGQVASTGKSGTTYEEIQALQKSPDYWVAGSPTRKKVDSWYGNK